jgi:hypothetical protein
LFALRQRTLDLQQQLAVNQQGVLAIEIIIRNNRELIRGVDRALDVTISRIMCRRSHPLSINSTASQSNSSWFCGMSPREPMSMSTFDRPTP